MQDPPPFENDRYASPPSEPEPKPSTPPRKWYRFTLWKMVVAFVLLGVVFAYLRYTHWGYVLSESITRVGRSFGLAEQRDPNKIYVSAVRPFGHASWEWSVEIPRGQHYSLYRRAYRIPVSGDPDEVERAEMIGTWDGAFMVEFKVESNGRSKGLSGYIYFIDHGYLAPRSSPLGWSAPALGDWMKGDFARDALSMEDGVQAFKPDEKIVLLRQWSPHSLHQDESGDYYEEGIMIWLEPATANNPWSPTRSPTATANGN